jgi:hypothetical protein
LMRRLGEGEVRWADGPEWTIFLLEFARRV